MRELDRPPEVLTDANATEMIRAWIANGTLHVSLLLGMWEDALVCEVDERKAWGDLFADILRHVANGLKQSHGWDEADTVHQIRAFMLVNLDTEEPEFSGGYPDGPQGSQ